LSNSNGMVGVLPNKLSLRTRWLSRQSVGLWIERSRFNSQPRRVILRKNLGQVVNLHLLRSTMPFIPIRGRWISTSFGWGLEILRALVGLASTKGATNSIVRVYHVYNPEYSLLVLPASCHLCKPLLDIVTVRQRNINGCTLALLLTFDANSQLPEFLCKLWI
jgi:hypothetical protein